MHDTVTPSRPIVFGEVLFDHFPDGKRVLGGAPFNVAWNLQGLGVRPLFLSAVGEDSEGTAILDAMDSWGLDDRGVQRLNGPPTGNVQVSFVDGQPEYEIPAGQAWDSMGKIDSSLWSDSAGLLYHGSLALRSESTRESWRHLVRESGLARFVDVNIRDPYFDESMLGELLNGAKWVKLNDEELHRLSDVAVTDQSSVVAGIETLKSRYEVHNAVVTCGSQGAYAIAESEILFEPAPSPGVMQDTVGAGDAFASAIIAGLASELPLPQILAGAVRLAARVCGLHGATSADRDIYQSVFE
ncbi:PfkB family carbohydrate kinase [Stieleria varia]|uniref:Aminoimidazole riboside kinase n=1 Tax=Stieleria varia TaxID=2528005 RepID=A0A5C6B8Z7_9BACT|nr:PfkB family carbohydrate kinase [Stieleria varia]TWU08440.1 aminoimidazole riboside kinase [Stieleria varia]